MTCPVCLQLQTNCCVTSNVEKGHKQTKCSAANLPLFDHLVGARKHGRWNCKAERFGGREIDNKLELGRLIDREIAGLRRAQNLVHIVCRSLTP